MSKLDEIEASFEKTIERAKTRSANNIYVWAMNVEEHRLLIRAARQLAAACEDIQYAGGNYKKLVDPEVLELIGGKE